MWKGWLSRHLEKSKESGYIHLLFRWKLRVSSQDWPTSGRIINVLDLTWSAGAIPTPCWPPLMPVTAFLLHLAHLCPSELPIHLEVGISLNVSTYWLSLRPDWCIIPSSLHTQRYEAPPTLRSNNEQHQHCIHGLSFNWSNKRKVWQRHWKLWINILVLYLETLLEM